MALVFQSATSIGGISFNGSPMIVSVGVNGTVFPSGSTLRQVRVICTALFKNKTYTRSFSGECDNGEVFTEDISTALRAAMFEDIQPDDMLPSSDTYKELEKASFSVQAKPVYMRYGEMIEGEATTYSNPCFAIPGRLTEMERNSMGSASMVGPSSPISLSTKPVSEGVVPSGHHLLSGYVIQHGTSLNQATWDYRIQRMTVPSSGNTTSFTDGAGVQRSFWIDTTHTYHEFLFQNRRGILEDACCRPLESLSGKVEKDSFAKTSMPSFKAGTSLRTSRAFPRRTWKMSSGPCSLEWAEWWAFEFLASERHWMLIDGAWMPVTVMPADENVLIDDRANPDALHIDFNVTLGLEG